MTVIDDLVDAIGDRIFGKKADKAPAERSNRELTKYGYKRRDGGFADYVEPPPEFAATSSQTAGLWPFCVGSSAALIGAPLGRHILNGSVVCGDPMSLFVRGVVSSPSAMVMGLNGRGKSSVIVRMLLYLDSLGFVPLVLSDLKPDYVGVTQEIGGEVLRVGPGMGSVNPLDAGPLRARLQELPADMQKDMKQEMHNRRVSTLRGLLELVRGKALDSDQQEPTVLSIAVRMAVERAESQGREPLIDDLVEVIEEAPQKMRAVTLSETAEEFRKVSRGLMIGLLGLGEDGPFGDLFCRPTSVSMPEDRPVCFDVSAVDTSDSMMRAAIQTVCWSYGQAVASAAKSLADARLAPERHHIMVMDEMWQVLRASERLVYQIDAITRLNRTKGLGQIMCTHTMKDMNLSTPELTEIARGFLERSSVKIFGGMAENEMPLLEAVIPLSDAEKRLLGEWSAEGAVDPNSGRTLPPPGRGRFMLKLGEGNPGVPFRMNLTPSEQKVHDTNEAWAEAMAGRQDR